MKTLALDLGTKTGYAVGDFMSGVVIAGTEHLATQKETAEQRRRGEERTHDIRYERLVKFTRKLVTDHAITRVIFEDVQFLSSMAQSQLWATWRAAVWHLRVDNPALEIQGVPVGTLKKYATGNGSAEKEEMAAALAKVSLAFDTSKLDDNGVDAVWLLLYAWMMDKTKTPWVSIWEKRRAERKIKADKQKKRAALKK